MVVVLFLFFAVDGHICSKTIMNYSSNLKVMVIHFWVGEFFMVGGNPDYLFFSTRLLRKPHLEKVSVHPISNQGRLN